MSPWTSSGVVLVKLATAYSERLTKIDFPYSEKASFDY